MSKYIKNISHQSGFTLLETLVALTILAISLGVIYQIFGTSMRNMQYSKDYSYARMLAESKLSEIGKGIPVIEGAFEGDFNDKYYWFMDVDPIDSLSNNNSINKYKINFKVLWESNRREQSIEILTYRLSPVGK